VTEIPEHLLKRSRERRSALGLGGDGDSAESAPSAAAVPATTSSAAPAPAASAAPAGRASAPAPASKPPVKPDSYVVQAYKRRKKIPMWAMLALSLLPIWAFMYARAVTTQVVEAAGPLGLGEEIYGSAGCGSCHGADGGPGNLGYPFAGGEVLKTFPHIEDQLRYVYYGTEQYNAAGIEIYGNPDREGGAHITGARNVMPAFGGGVITDYELLSVVCHERYTLGGTDPADPAYAEEYETWCAEESEIFLDLEAGGDLRDIEARFPDAGIIPIGFAPAEGSPAGE
jgi:mono/diheme cytochrome c family protein